MTNLLNLNVFFTFLLNFKGNISSWLNVLMWTGQSWLCRVLLSAVLIGMAKTPCSTFPLMFLLEQEFVYSWALTQPTHFDLKMEATYTSKTSAPLSTSAWCKNPREELTITTMRTSISYYICCKYHCYALVIWGLR